VREPLDILDEIERELGMPCVPMTWPVGQGKTFGGIMNLRTQAMTVFDSGKERLPQEFETIALDNRDELLKRFGREFESAEQSMELAAGASPAWDREAFLAGKQTPVFFGSGVNNFGVAEVLDALVDLAPSPRPRTSHLSVNRQVVEKVVEPDDANFAGVVFKVQANMDRSHRDRIAFVRICSGRFERGMTMTVARTGKPFATKYASTTFGAKRSTVEEAFPGDVVGLVNATGLQLGDTLFEDLAVSFPGIPRFAPELFTNARPRDTSRVKQFRRGIEVLEEEGVVQVLRDPSMGDAALVLAAVGQLQFEVFAHRLESEFNAPVEMTGSPYQAIRGTDDTSADRLRQIGGIRILDRADGTKVALFENIYRLQRLLVDEPKLTLKSLNVD
ncbi:MAG TPA: peptide chain release factor 3, partial [Ilumatobacteraceae bacterium]